MIEDLLEEQTSIGNYGKDNISIKLKKQEKLNLLLAKLKAN